MTFVPTQENETVGQLKESKTIAGAALDAWLLQVRQRGVTDPDFLRALTGKESVVEGLRVLDDLKDAATIAGIGIDVYGAISDLQQGDFGSAEELALNLVLEQIIREGLGEELENVVRRSIGLDIGPAVNLPIYDSLVRAVTGVAEGAIADIATNAVLELRDAIRESLIDQFGRLEGERIAGLNEGFADLNFKLAVTDFATFDDEKLPQLDFSEAVRLNIALFGAEVADQSYSTNGVLISFSTAGSDRAKFERLLEVRENWARIDLTIGESVSDFWNLGPFMQGFSQRFVTDIDSTEIRTLAVSAALDFISSNFATIENFVFARGYNSGLEIAGAPSNSLFLSAETGTTRGTAARDIILGGINILGGGESDLLIATQGVGAFIAGEDGDDIIIGSRLKDIIRGNDDDDTISGGGGGDEIYGGDDIDNLFGDAGIDNIYGDDGEDLIEGGSDGDFLYGGDMADEIYGGSRIDLGEDAGVDFIDGENGNDRLFGGGGGDTIEGGVGADQLFGNAEQLVLGGSSRDIDDGASDTLRGEAGFDRYYVNDGDIIEDSDGDGAVYFADILLTGGEPIAETPDACSNGEQDSQEDGARMWRGSEGETYRLSDGDLIVEYNGAEITIRNYNEESGDLRIELGREDPGDGGDCQPPESDPDGDGGDGSGGGSSSPDAFSSPLVLDLDGDGLELTFLKQSATFFDIDSDGIRERTSWVSADDGLLVLDRNGNGLIDSGQELFGYGETVSAGSRSPGDDVLGGFFDPEVVDISGPNDLELDFRSGFDVLSDLDTNNDLVIDANDVQFNELRIWRDLNQDGASQEEELFSLPEVGVLSISLEGQSVFLEDTGNLITDTSTYQTTDGQTREVSDVWFRFNQYDTRFDTPDDLDPLIAALPSLNGSGAIVPLHLAMAENSTLQTLVEEFSTLTLSELGRVPVLMDQILYEWAGASDIHFEFRGRYADARQVAVMEAFTDTPFAQWSGSDPRPQAGAVLGDQFSVIAQSFAARLIAQSNLGQELIPELSYQYNQFLILETNVDSSVVLQRLTDNLPSDAFDALAYLQAGVRLLDMIYLSFSDVAAAADAGAGYRATVEGILTSAGLNLTYGQLLGAQVGGDGEDQILTDSARDNGFLPDAPVVSGGRGDDEIVIGGGEQIALWGTGQGNDTIEIDPIVRTAIDFQPRVTIYMQNLDRSEVSFLLQDSDFNKELVIQIDATGETLTIENLGTVSGEAGQLIFADGTIVLFSELASILAEASANGGTGDDLVVQINNEFTLDGGAGDDLLIGISGDTEYTFDVGGGNDIIRDDNVGDNQISFGPNLLSSDVEFERAGIQESDLIIRIISTGETLTIQNQFLRETPVVSQFFFQSDFNELEAQDIANQFAEDDAGDNTVLGTGADETFDLDAGNDLIRGFNGSDTYRIGSQSFGQDTIDDGGRLGEDTVVFQANVLADFQIGQDNGDFIFTNTNNGDELVCSPESGPLFELVPASDMELNYGQ
ncbi:MAG: hypothetical protein JJ919_17840, partial [Henriciella sp.]|nr:hypothetical protein [Henriciella sp.]